MNVKNIKNKVWADRGKLARVGIIVGSVLPASIIVGSVLSASIVGGGRVDGPSMEDQQALEAPATTEAAVELHPSLAWFVAQLDSIELIDSLNDDLVAGIESGNIPLAVDSAGAIGALYTDLFFDAPSGTDYTGIVVEDAMLTCGLAHDLAADALVSGDAWSLEYAADELDACVSALAVINGLMADAVESF